MSYEWQKSKIKRHLGDLHDVLARAGCILAGGALTSIFTNTPVNDWDIYFTSKEGVDRVITALYGLNVEEDLASFDFKVNFMTEKSILTEEKYKGAKVQLIHYRIFEDAFDIFDKFDFTINMCAYDFAKEEFVFHDNFFLDVARRTLQFHSGTEYPLISLMRVRKYTDRGYYISKAQMLRIAIETANRKYESWDQIIDVIGSMYGLENRALFDTTKPFSLDEVVAQLDTLNVEGGTLVCESYSMRELIDGTKNCTDNVRNWVNTYSNSFYDPCVKYDRLTVYPHATKSN